MLCDSAQIVENNCCRLKTDNNQIIKPESEPRHVTSGYEHIKSAEDILKRHISTNRSIINLSLFYVGHGSEFDSGIL